MKTAAIKPERKIQVIRPDPAAIRYLKNRRRRRCWALIAASVLAGSVVAGHFAIIKPVGDDWSRFDHRSFVIDSADGGTISIRGVGPVRLSGVAIPSGNEAGTAGARAWLSNELAGQSVVLMVTGPQSRDPDGSLRARIYRDGTDDIALAAVKAGIIYVDRRGTDPFRPALAAAEADARKHDRGLWAGLRFDQMPSWRQAWLRERKR